MLNKIHRFFFNLFFKTFYISQKTGVVKDKEKNTIGNYVDDKIKY